MMTQIKEIFHCTPVHPGRLGSGTRPKLRGGPDLRVRMAAWLRWILGFWVRLRRQFLLVCLRSIDLVGRPSAEGRVWSIGVVIVDSASDSGSCLAAGLEGIQEHAFVFNRSP